MLSSLSTLRSGSPVEVGDPYLHLLETGDELVVRYKPLERGARFRLDKREVEVDRSVRLLPGPLSGRIEIEGSDWSLEFRWTNRELSLTLPGEERNWMIFLPRLLLLRRACCKLDKNQQTD